MGFLAPLSLFFALSIPALVLLYLLRVKRQPRRVSSTWLWQRTIEDARASVPFQRLRRHLLMLLQILALALLTFALARPVMNLVTRERGSVLILIDRSASMSARTGSGDETRLDVARRKATELVRSLGRGSQVALVAYAERPEVAAAFTTDFAAVRRALAGVSPTAAADDLKSAIWLAASIVPTVRNPRIVIFSDTAVLTPELLDLLPDVPTVVEICGSARENVGWTNLNVRRNSQTSSRFDLFATLVSHKSAPVRAEISFESDSDLIDVRWIDLAPGQETSIVLEDIMLAPDSVLRATLVLKEEDERDSRADGEPSALEDSLDADNEVWAVVKADEEKRVLLCTSGNYFLSRALGAMEALTVVQVEPGEAAPPGRFDFAIYDRGTPDPLPKVPALYIGRSPWKSGEIDDLDLLALPAEGTEVFPGEITNWDAKHPVTRLVRWPTVDIFGLTPMHGPEGSKTLVETARYPVLILGRADKVPVLVLTFDLYRSNFPLRAAFPIFLRDSTEWLMQGRGADAVRTLRGGETYRLALDEGEERATIIAPSGKIWKLDAGQDRTIAFAQTYEAGIYRVETGGDLRDRFAVSVLSPVESDLAVGESIRIDKIGDSRPVGLGSELRTNREVWKWPVLVALVILLGEWVLYRRFQIA